MSLFGSLGSILGGVGGFAIGGPGGAALGSGIGGSIGGAFGGGGNGMSSIFGGGAPNFANGPTNYQQLPKYMQDALTQLISRGTSLSNTLDPATQQAYNMGTSGPPAMGFMKGAQNAYGQASNFQNQISPQIGMANGYLNAANNNISQGTNPITAQMIGNQAEQLMSPYTQNVINSLQNTLMDQRNQMQSQNNSNSTLAGAFGSNRAALNGGQIDLAAQRALAEQSGTLLNNAYQTAATNAQQNLQNERSNFLAGAGLNINQAAGALGGANSYANAANSATNLGNANLYGNQQNNANYNNRINQLTTAGKIPQNQLGILQSAIGGYQPFSQGGSSQAYQPQGLLQQLGLTPSTGLNGMQQGMNGNSSAITGLLSSLFGSGNTDLGNTMPWLSGGSGMNLSPGFLG